MAKRNNQTTKSIENYLHNDKHRLNNPPVGLVNNSTDQEYGQSKKQYDYDPHLDPQLMWSGKTDHTSFKVPTVSLHVHERIDPKTIINSVQREHTKHQQLSLFEQEEKPLREAIEFYKHKEGWTNRLIAGDSLLVMNSLLEKEGMAGKVQMMYFDPPYGISYGSNFQPFTNKKDVKDGKDEDLTQEPEMIKAFRDTWELGIHSYLAYLRDRLLLAKELLHESGSIFIQISDENIHHVRELLDEVFGASNFVSLITFQTKIPLRNKYMANVNDYIIWYGKGYSDNKLKYHQLFQNQSLFESSQFGYVELSTNEIRSLKLEERINPSLLPKNAKVFASLDLSSSGRTESCVFEFEYLGKKYNPTANKSWKTNLEGMRKLAKENRLFPTGNTLRYKLYHDDFPVKSITNLWNDSVGVGGKIYVVQTDVKPIQRCMLMTSDPGDIVLDITCGSGTTAVVAEQWGRRWITCDTSRIAITLAKQRLMTNSYEYYILARPQEGVGSGFKYKTVPHITIGSITNNLEPPKETLYDQAIIDTSKTRITGPFTVESIPAPFVKNLDGETIDEIEVDKSIVREGETLRQDQWRDELLRTGVRAKGGAMMEFNRIEALSGTKYIQAQGETKGDNPEQVLIVFGPEHAPLEQRIIELAMEEARYLKPDILLFCAFQFDEEAAKDIDETPEKLVGFKLLKAHMNMDLQTDDLKKNRSTNQSFWLIGQPDVRVHDINEGEDAGMVTVEVHGFDYFNPKTGKIDSGGKKNIAMWLLDTDYDGRSIFPSQVFFPMAGSDEGWSKLAKNLKAEIDVDKMDAFHGTESLPFKPGKQIAVKIIDDRGIESLKIVKR